MFKLNTDNWGKLTDSQVKISCFLFKCVSQTEWKDSRSIHFTAALSSFISARRLSRSRSRRSPLRSRARSTLTFTLLPASLSAPSNLCGLPADRPDFTWARAINALTLDFNQAICLRAGTASACPGWLRQTAAVGEGGGGSVCQSASIPAPRPLSTVSRSPLKGCV